MSSAPDPTPLDIAPPALGGAWQRLAQARTVQSLCQAWLAVLCGELTHARAGIVLLADADGSFAPAGAWPIGRDLSGLAEIARQAMVERSGTTERTAEGHLRCAYPLLSATGDLLGSVVIDLGHASAEELARCRQWLHWGAAWLLDLASQRALRATGERLEQTALVLDLVLAAMGAATFREATLAVVNRIAHRLDCQQVTLGLERGRRLRVQAVSNAAVFDERTVLVHQAVQAMSEAADQRARVVWPAPEGSTPLADLALRRHAEASGAAAVCAQPLELPGRVIGVLLLERAQPFANDELRLIEVLGLALAPTLEQRLRSDEGLIAHGRRAARLATMRITDTSHPGLKLAGALAGLALLALALVPAPFRISAPATVEGTVQRAAVAPFEGYVRSASARAGDIVRAGQVLAQLEDKELKLERLRWEAEHQVAQRKESEAMAAGQRVNQRLAAAQANQALAQLELASDKLARVTVTAPFDGVVVKGDLSQQLGSPVQQGQVLFEIATLDAWRVVLKVDERDIAYIQPGQPGELVLASLPNQAWAFTVKKLTPVSVAEEGRNFFRVEADLGRQAPALSPNMQGIAKVSIDQRGLLWIWTRPLLDWLRLAWWNISP